VKEGDLIAEIMAEKAQYEIRAPASGVIAIVKAADEIVAKGDVIGSIS
jgi:pyruvate/2-oxoglutarate dehydrogenase complex dihydrolipoamide acyltransferase (E2) component